MPSSFMQKCLGRERKPNAAKTPTPTQRLDFGVCQMPGRHATHQLAGVSGGLDFDGFGLRASLVVYLFVLGLRRCKFGVYSKFMGRGLLQVKGLRPAWFWVRWSSHAFDFWGLLNDAALDQEMRMFDCRKRYRRGSMCTSTRSHILHPCYDVSSHSQASTQVFLFSLPSLSESLRFPFRPQKPMNPNRNPWNVSTLLQESFNVACWRQSWEPESKYQQGGRRRSPLEGAVLC